MVDIKKMIDALEELKLIFPTIPKNAKIVPFLKIHEDGN